MPIMAIVGNDPAMLSNVLCPLMQLVVTQGPNRTLESDWLKNQMVTPPSFLLFQCLTFLFWACTQIETVAIASLLHLHNPGLVGQQFQTGCFSLEFYLLFSMELVSLLVHQQEHDTASGVLHLQQHTQVRMTAISKDNAGKQESFFPEAHSLQL